MIWLQMTTDKTYRYPLCKMRCVVNKIPKPERKPDWVSLCVFLQAPGQQNTSLKQIRKLTGQKGSILMGQLKTDD